MSDLKNFPSDNIINSSDTNFIVSKFNSSSLELRDKHALVIKKRIYKCSTPWITNPISNLMKQSDDTYGKAKKPCVVEDMYSFISLETRSNRS